jgi:hypothetical protein
MQRPDIRLVRPFAVFAAVSNQQPAASSRCIRLACLLAILSLILAAPPACAGLKFFQATTTAIILSSNPVNPGHPLTLTGRVRDARRAPVGGGRVQIQVAETPEGPWEVLDEGKPDAKGNFQIVEHTLGLESRPFFLRAGFSGHDDGRVCYRASMSPPVPLVANSLASRADEGLAMGFVEASGDTSPGPGGGSWEYVIRAKALKDVIRAVFQGYASDWVPLAGAVLDFQADAGQVLARAPEDDTDDTLITWRLDRLLAGDEAILRVIVDGDDVEEGVEGGAGLTMTGEDEEISDH